jgi:hypothetical protein
MAAEDQLRTALAEAVIAATNLGEGTVTSITVDIQPSGELPYRLQILEDVVPYAGITSLDLVRASGATSPARSDKLQPGAVKR